MYERREHMAARLMGIEIGNTHIKILEVVKNKTKIEIKKFSLLNTPPNCIQDGIISQMDPIKKIIIEELRAKKYHANKVVVVVQSSQILTRHVIVDQQPEKMMELFIQIKLDTFLPIDDTQYEIDFKILETLEQEGKIKNKLMLVAVPKIVVLPIMDLIKSLRLRPLSITIPSETLERIFCPVVKRESETAHAILVLDIGGYSTRVTILEGERTYLTRIVDFGIAHLDEKNTEKEVYFTKVIRPQMEYHILSEIERILQFYYSNQEASAIKRIYLIGGGAKMKEIKSYIRDALNLPVEDVESLKWVDEIANRAFKPYISFFVHVLGAIQMF